MRRRERGRKRTDRLVARASEKDVARARPAAMVTVAFPPRRVAMETSVALTFRAAAAPEPVGKRGRASADGERRKAASEPVCALQTMALCVYKVYVIRTSREEAVYSRAHARFEDDARLFSLSLSFPLHLSASESFSGFWRFFAPTAELRRFSLFFPTFKLSSSTRDWK